MRYQRHVDHIRQQHIRETVEQLDRVVAEDDIATVVLAGDDQALSMVRDELPSRLAEKVVDGVRLDIDVPDRELLERTLEAVLEHAREESADAVASLVGAYKSGGLAVLGPEEVVEALERGQADEVFLTTNLDELVGEDGDGERDADRKWLAADIVAKARETGATVRFVEDDSLLRPAGGAGATLRYRI